jgi:chorismate mutase
MILDGSQKGLSEEFIIQFFKAIHQESIAHQEKVFNS